MIDLKRLARSFKHAFAGVHYALNHDQNLLIHFFAAFFVVLLSVVFKITPFEMSILGVTILLVISAEMINSALEKMVDLITKEHRVEARYAKDVAAGMVLMTTVGSVIVGFLIFLPYILRLFR